MKQIGIISGKGGTGKTVITASFASLAKDAIFADCDVDAADLHLLLKPEIIERHKFKSGKVAKIDKKFCQRCGKCLSICRFSAITEDFVVDPISCEGCCFCSYVCPAEAIRMEEKICGEWFISNTRFGKLIHAKLGVAEENSGKLVSLVREKAKQIAEKENCSLIIIDGSPGIGCPVIASLSGLDYAIVVVEPTLSGLHDADRVIKVAWHFGVSVKLIINKFNLNTEVTERIENYCQINNIPIIGKIKFDESVVKAMVEGKTIIEYQDTEAKREITKIWHRLEKEIA